MMNNYIIYGEEEFDENDNDITEKEILTHEESISDETLERVCNKAKNKLILMKEIITLEKIVNILVEDYRFKKIEFQATYKLRTKNITDL